MKSTSLVKQYALNPELLANKHPNVVDLVDKLQAGYINRKATAANYTALVTDHYIGVTDTSAARTITLPTAAAAGAGKAFIIKDEDGNATTNNLTVDAAASETIDGATTKVIDANYASVTIVCDGTAWFTI